MDTPGFLAYAAALGVRSLDMSLLTYEELNHLVDIYLEARNAVG